MKLFSILRRGRFVLLLLSAAALLASQPVLETFDLPLLRILLAVLFLSGVNAVSQNRRDVLVVAVLAVATTLASSGASVTQWRSFLFAEHVGCILFGVFTAGVVLRHVLRDAQVTADTLCGAIGAYLLIGWTFAVIYSLLELQNPQAIDYGAEEAAMSFLEIGRGRFSSFLYFSFVTLSTLGYGAILPVTRAARTVAYSEAIVGQLYLAILVARLVGMTISSRPDRTNPNAA